MKLTFAEISKQLRKEKSISQADLAKALNVSNGCVAMLETNKSEPTANTLTKYAEFFGCTTDYLLGREDESALFKPEVSLEPKQQKAPMNRIRELRLERNLRQKDVAQAIGVLPQSYGFYENGINKPDPDTLIRLADFFECSIDCLLGRTDDFGTVVASGAGNEQYTQEEKQLVESFRRLDLYRRLRLVGYADALVDEQANNPKRKA